MQNQPSIAPAFTPRNHHAVLRAATIIALCAALTGAFLKTTWRTPSAASQESGSSLVRCADGTTARHC